MPAPPANNAAIQPVIHPATIAYATNMAGVTRIQRSMVPTFFVVKIFNKDMI